MITFLEDEVELSLHDTTLTKERSVWYRRLLDENMRRESLSRYISGQIPYYYREPAKIAEDFNDQIDALGIIADMCRKLPITEKFRCSHFGEILASIYLENVLGYKVLLRKLSLLTAEDTNVHKMDVLCVDTTKNNFEYWWYEVKTSIQPTGNQKVVYHRNGIYRQLLDSLEKYRVGDKLFDFVQIRDNINSSNFSDEERTKIRKQLCPPGPLISLHGMVVINILSINNDDNDYLLSTPSEVDFNVRMLAISDLKKAAIDAYDRLEKIKEVTEG